MRLGVEKSSHHAIKIFSVQSLGDRIKYLREHCLSYRYCSLWFVRCVMVCVFVECPFLILFWGGFQGGCLV
jgi:hypothetical protein